MFHEVERHKRMKEGKKLSLKGVKLLTGGVVGERMRRKVEAES